MCFISCFPVLERPARSPALLVSNVLTGSSRHSNLSAGSAQETDPSPETCTVLPGIVRTTRKLNQLSGPGAGFEVCSQDIFS